MKTNKKKSSSSKTKNRLALAATVLSVPLMSAPGWAQGSTGGRKADSIAAAEARSTDGIFKFSTKFVKVRDDFSIVGMDDGHTIYEKANGELFFVDPDNGNMKSVSRKGFEKWQDLSMKTTGRLSHIKFNNAEKQHYKVHIVGVDAQGNTVMQNAQGEKFHLNPTTGDMVFEK